jgi:hypothetical protein
MRYYALVLALSLNAVALAGDGVKPPKGLPPRFMTVAKIDKDNIELIEVQTVEGRPTIQPKVGERLASSRSAGSIPRGRSWGGRSGKSGSRSGMWWSLPRMTRR